jgi:hypothetical protein
MCKRSIFVSSRKKETHVTIVIESEFDNDDCRVTEEMKKALKNIKHLGLDFSFAVINVKFPNQE